jgi:DNA mismatch repair protein MutH
MEREEALTKLKQLERQDLRALANKYQITVWMGDKKNKGWAGHTLERYLGLPINSAQSSDFGSWEPKIVPLKRDLFKRLSYQVKI